jgi:hypothetical protein
VASVRVVILSRAIMGTSLRYAEENGTPTTNRHPIENRVVTGIKT